MESTINSSTNPKDFKPFEITFKIECIKEARLFFHITNSNNLRHLLLDDLDYDREEEYDRTNVEDNLDCNAYRLIREEIEKQGFKI